ncbi:hypothetical protein HMPREF1199_01234 [Hoylesella oralis CC98A]|nr:hypothetical protein HMPREF1199_01234 [Hoylesella oralis CC98A]
MEIKPLLIITSQPYQRNTGSMSLEAWVPSW